MTEQLDTAISTAAAALTDAEQLRRRAAFFATALAIHCSDLLGSYIGHCKEKALEESLIPPIGEEDFASSVKTLLSISMWLTLLEQTSDVAKQLREFAVVAMNLADRLYATPSAREVMQEYDIGSGVDGLCDSASFSLCLRLNLGSSCPDALVHLGEIMRQARVNRQAILHDALTHPVDDLDKLLPS